MRHTQSKINSSNECSQVRMCVHLPHMEVLDTAATVRCRSIGNDSMLLDENLLRAFLIFCPSSKNHTFTNTQEAFLTATCKHSTKAQLVDEKKRQLLPPEACADCTPCQRSCKSEDATPSPPATGSSLDAISQENGRFVLFFETVASWHHCI